ncbi:MAG: ATP-binding protein [Planctomycetaceae bacterium]
MDGMRNDRGLEDARRLELQLVTLRWLVAAFGAVQVGFAIRDHARDPSFVLPLGAALVVGVALGNLLIAASARGAADARRMRWVGVVAFALDAVVLIGLIWITTDGRADPVWVVGYLLPLEGAARWGVRGATVGALLFLAGQVALEWDLSVRRPNAAAGAQVLAFRVGMAFVVGVVLGSFVESLRRQASVADERALEAEASATRAAEAAERERQARGEVAAFHAAVLTDPGAEGVERSVQSTADAIARELGCESFAILVLEHGLVGEPAFVAQGVHGDPGYLHGERLSPASDPVAAAAMEDAPVLAPPDLVAQMRVRGRVVGALHERSETRPPDEERLTLLSRLADQVGLVLESTRMRADQEETVRRLQELDEMKTDFVAITSHELRTPLAGIRGFVEMLRRRADELSDAEREEFLDIVLAQTDRLVHLVDDLLVVSRVEAGKLVLEPEETELGPFVARVILGLGEESDRVRIVPAADAPERMLVDPRRLAQVLTNLVHNAVKFSPAGTEVVVRWGAEAEGTVTFSVTDRGPGIEAEELSRIFDRFHQTERSISHSEGFGLGLYITKLLTEAMGGWIDVRSEVGDGTTFSVTLPGTRPSTQPAGSAQTSA